MGQNGGKKLWDIWLKVKRDIINVDNLAVKATILQMPGGALPSGTDLELFLTRLLYELHKKKVNFMEISEDGEQEGETGDDLGGSAAKAAGLNAFTDMGTGNEDEDEEEIQGTPEIPAGPNDFTSEIQTPEIAMAISKEELREDERKEDDVHDEPKAPKGFLPPYLLVILTMGFLSTECEGSLDYVGTSMVIVEHNATTPSRETMREDALSDAASSLTSTPYQDPVARLKEHASFNEAYARVQGTKNDIARTKLEMEREMVGMKKQEIDARSREVSAREKEVKEAHLHSLYVDFRDDLKLALEMNDQEEAARIREEMRNVKRRCLE